MIQFSIRALILRAREFYSRVKPILTKAGQLATAVTAAKNAISGLVDADSQFSIRQPHRDSDRITICFFITLLWIDLQRRDANSDAVDKGNLDALMEDCLGDAIKTIAKFTAGLPLESSVNETYASLISVGTRAYLDNKAPQWDATLLRMFDKNAMHPVAEAYVSAYGDIVLSNDRWLTAMKVHFPDISSEEMRVHLNFLIKLSKDEDMLKVSIEMARSTRTNWYSYLPTAMFIASQQLFKSYLYFTPVPIAGRLVSNGIPSTIMTTSSYSASRNLSRAKTVTPKVYLPKPYLDEIREAERAARIAAASAESPTTS